MSLLRHSALALLLAPAALAPSALAQTATTSAATTSAATTATPTRLTLEKLFASPEFFGTAFEGGRWADAGAVLRSLSTDAATGATSLVEQDLASGRSRTLIDGARLARPDGPGLLTVEDYAYSADGTRALLFTDSERVWRLNTKGLYYVVDLASGAVTPVADRAKGLQMFAKFSPDGRQVAFVRDRNLYVTDLATGAERALTTSGAPGTVINGTFDWVYEEEFGLRDGFQWSPDGARIAFYQLDESATRDFQITNFQTLYPEYQSFRYPKAGEANAEIHVGVVDVATGLTRFFDTDTWGPGSGGAGGAEHEYIAGMGWTPALPAAAGQPAGRSEVWMLRLNRNQNRVDLMYADPAGTAARTVLSEQNDSYIEVETGFSDVATGTITYLRNGREFVWRSDRDGFGHLYLYRTDGTLVRPITSGPWDVTNFHGVDERAGMVYVTTTAAGPRERQLYRVPLAGSVLGEPFVWVPLTQGAGWHDVDVSRDFAYFTDTYSTQSTPPVTSLYRASGERVSVLDDNADLIERLAAYDLPTPEYLTVPAADGTPLAAYLVKPRDFDPSRRYPLLIHTYGGPGSQEVVDRWGGTERLWHQYLAETYGVLVAGVDNRGTGGRGKAFKTLTQNRLGILEAEDQTAAARWFGRQAYVDSTRLGIWGWSYGGYLSLLAMTYGDGPDVFHAGIAVAPVTNWRTYDTIYTERYLSTPQLNAAGYDAGSPTTYAANLRDDQRLLIVHGDADDNVHVQNTMAMVDALQAAGKPFEMMLYPGRNHGLYGGRTRLHLYTLLTRFVAENLAGEALQAQR